jgi:LmbE family N-acetylglucosaminyl deacetylase
VDHHVTVAALNRLPGRPPVVWWADLPYAARTDAPPPSRFAALEEIAAATSPSAEQDRKLAACRAYRSQLGFQFPDGVEVVASPAYVERFRAEPAARRLLAA